MRPIWAALTLYGVKNLPADIGVFAGAAFDTVLAKRSNHEIAAFTWRAIDVIAAPWIHDGIGCFKVGS